MAIESIAEKNKFTALQTQDQAPLNVGLNVAGDKVSEAADVETAKMGLSLSLLRPKNHRHDKAL